jgi:hypothetical protein
MTLNVEGTMNQDSGPYSRDRGVHQMESRFCEENLNGREMGRTSRAGHSN